MNPVESTKLATLAPEAILGCIQMILRNLTVASNWLQCGYSWLRKWQKRTTVATVAKV